jgi:hypothetical protein
MTQYVFKLPGPLGPGDEVQILGPDPVPPKPTPPSPPIGLTVLVGDTVASLAWTLPTSDGGSPITGYIVHRSPGVDVAIGVTTSYADSGLTNGTAYQWSVSAVNAAGTSLPSNVAAGTPVAPPIVLPFPGFQKANDAAQPGATIIVPDGTYREAFTVTKTGLTFQAQNAGAAIVDGRDSATGAVVRQTWALLDADHVTLRGLHFQYAGNPTTYGGVRILPGRSFALIDSCEVDHTLVGIANGMANDSQILDCHVHDCDRLGIHGGGDGKGTTGFRNVIKGGKLHHNGYGAGQDPENEAGGYKGTLQTDALFDGVEGYDNHGPAFWMDIYGQRTVYQNLVLHDNTHYGVMEEVSYNGKVLNCVTYRNGFGKATWGWGAGILVSSSTGTEVAGNVCAWDHVGISVVSQNRSDWPNVKPPKNINVHGNTCVGKDGATLMGWFQDWGTDTSALFDPAGGCRGDANQYWLPGPEDTRTRWVWQRTNWSYTKLANWQKAQGGGPNCTYLTTAQKDALLAAKNIPTS